MENQRAQFLAQLESLRVSFFERLPEKVAELKTAWQAVLSNPGQIEQLNEFHRFSHSLKGTAATFGYEAISDIACSVDDLAKLLIEQDEPATAEQQDKIVHLIEQLNITCRTPSNENAVKEEKDEQPIGVRPADQISKRLIYLVDTEQSNSSKLVASLSCNGYTVQTYHSFNELSLAFNKQLPSTLMMEAKLADNKLIGDLYAGQSITPMDLPFFVLAESDNFADRLTAIRMGATGYYVKPPDINLLVRHLDNIHNATLADLYRVLIVDDSKPVAEHHAITLRRGGLTTQSLSEPEHIIDAIEEFRPDVILMDLYMPQCSGLELTRLIRLREDFNNIAVIYLSAETNKGKQLAVLSQSGGDDFLTKPIETEHLHTAVVNRAKRGRLVQAQSMLDQLTGLYNLIAFEKILQNEIVRARQLNSAAVLAILDVDQYDAIIDQYGLIEVSHVLRGLAKLIQRIDDSVLAGRFGVKEFALIMPGASLTAATQMLEKLRDAFANTSHDSGGPKHSTTLSCGITTCANYPTIELICEKAAFALYDAKNQGGNRIVVADQ